MTTRPSVVMEQQDLVTATQIIRHIAELLQYDRVRKLANVRIAFECDRPALAGSRDIPSCRLIAAASLWHSCASPGAVPSSVRMNGRAT
jgi:hypothetical protein